MKLGVIGEEMVATAVRLAQERGADVTALHVVRVPLDLPPDAPMIEEEERAEASIAEAKCSARITASSGRADRAGARDRGRDRARARTSTPT